MQVNKCAHTQEHWFFTWENKLNTPGLEYSETRKDDG